MGPNTVYIIAGAGFLIASLVAYLVYSSFKRAGGSAAAGGSSGTLGREGRDRHLLFAKSSSRMSGANIPEYSSSPDFRPRYVASG